MTRIPQPRTVFLDRDGVINHDAPDYIRSWGEFHFLPGSLSALKMLAEKKIRVIVVTNQSGVGRGLIAPETLEDMFRRMRAAVESSGGRIDDILHCPHAPDDNCRCRKPLPGMILTAAERHGIDLRKSVMVGDSARDIECGKAAGCGRTVLVRTGIHPDEAIGALVRKNIPPDLVADNLLLAAKWIIEQNLDG